MIDERFKGRTTRKIAFRFLIAILILPCLTLAAYKLLSGAGNKSEGLSLLKEVYKNHRSIESRVVDFAYAPLINTRGAEPAAASGNTSTDYVERILLDAVHYEPEAQSHHDLGVFHLLNKRFDRAIEEFEKALVYEPSNAKLHNDLGSALFEKGKTELAKESLQSQITGRPVEYFSRSIEHLHKALDQNASLKEAVFNLGLIQQELNLHFAARDSFSKYLESDPDSSWAGEAKAEISLQDGKQRALSLSNEELLSDFLNAFKARDDNRAWKLICENRSPLNGRYITELIVDSYIDHSLSSEKAEAAESLAALSFLAELEVQRADEHYTEKLIEFYKARQPGEIAGLKRARDLVKRGHDLYVLDKGDEAVAAYSGAKKEFDRLKDKVESLSAEYRIAFCESENRNIAGSSPAFKRMADLCEKQKFRLLRIRNLLGTASNEFSGKAYSKAISYGSQSFELARQVSDQTSAFSSLVSCTEFYRGVGNHKKTLACIQNSLEYSDCPSIHRLQRFGYHSRVASALSAAGYPDASLEFRKEASRFLMRDVPRDAALYFADLGATYSKLKKYDEAATNLNTAYEEAKAVSPEPARNLIVSYVALHKGYLYKSKREFQTALSSYSEALDLSGQAAFPIFAYQARKGRLYDYIALGEDAMAENEISETLKTLESDRSEILEQENRNSFFDAEQDIYDLAIDYEYSRRDNPNKAFDYSEESRSRSLLDLLKSQAQVVSSSATLEIPPQEASPPLTLETICERLPENLQVIQYSVLASKIVIWVLGPRHFSKASSEISQEELNNKVKAYLNNISQYSEDRSGDISAQSKELYDILIKPVADLLKRDGTVCVVPDKVLNNLPFESLLSSQTQNYLVEDFAVLYSPSSSVLLACIEGAKNRQKPDADRLLAVGNPDFDRNLFKELSSLPAAKREVERIAGYYQDSIPLISNAAREEKVKSEMQRATVIHFATHSLLDENSVLRSKILLSKETAQGDGALESYEIYKTKLPKTRLVILSSCQSGIDRYYNGEGMMSLARSFLVAGVPTVIASLWKVDSDAAADLMIEFHRLKQQEHLSVAESLRRAKLSLLKEPNGRFRNPYFWSAFMITGGQASFLKTAKE